MRTISLIRHGKSTYGIRGRASCCRIDWTRFFNQLLAEELREKRLDRTKKTNTKHWYSTTYSFG